MREHWRMRLGLGLVVLVCASAGPAAQTSARRQIQVHIERAREAMKANQLSLAVEEYRAILRLDPASAEAHANLGVIAYTRGEYSAAAQSFRSALKLKPSLSNAQAFLGMCLARLGNAREARPWLEKSLARVGDPKLQAQAGLALAGIYERSGDLERVVDVLRILEQARSQDPDVLYTAYRAYSDLAARALSSLARSAPESARMHQVLAQALETEDNFPEAIVQYRKAIGIDHRLPGLHFALGRAILANSHDAAALKEAEAAFLAERALDATDPNVEYMLGEICFYQSRLEEAAQHYSRALELRPEFVDGRVALGKVLTTLGGAEQALGHLQEAVRLDSENEVAHYRLAQAFRKLGRADDAAREMAAFKRLRDAQAPIRSLYEQFRQKSVPSQTLEPGEAP